MTKPMTHQRDLAKLPKALGPLIERKQWCGMALDTKAGWSVAKAAVSGDTARAARQHK